MATIRHEVVIKAASQHIWDVIRGIGAVHERLLPGRVVHTRVEGAERYLTFPDGHIIHELIVAIDEQSPRLAYIVTSGARPHWSTTAHCSRSAAKKPPRHTAKSPADCTVIGYVHGPCARDPGGTPCRPMGSTVRERSLGLVIAGMLGVVVGHSTECLLRFPGKAGVSHAGAVVVSLDQAVSCQVQVQSWLVTGG
jgi:hypothetical protein